MKFRLFPLARRIAWFLVALAPAVAAAAGAEGPRQVASRILAAAGVKGGLVVHLGCGDGELTAALGASGPYLVQGLDPDPANVEKARAHIRSLGLYGKVSVERWAGGHLPYADNLVNLAVVSGDIFGPESVPTKVAEQELMRVLAPNGVALVERGGEWVKTVKPWPKEMDEWTHSLHDAGDNPVSRDRVVGPPRQIQWTAGPLWARSHGWTPSVSAMVSARGRWFAICDETLTGVDGTVPDKWFLVARDAFSGVLLWKRPVPNWGSRAFSGIPNTGRGVTTGRFTMPPQVAKRLVAVGETVYVTLGATAPVTALDAATGKVRRVYAGTENADEILHSDGRLIVAINPPPEARPPVAPRDQSPAPPPGKHVCALDAATGRLLWKRGPFTGIRASRGQDPFGRLELAAGDGRVFVLTTQAIECLDAATGRTAWRTQRPALPKSAVRRLGFAGMYEYLLTVMVYHGGVVLLAQPEPNIHHTYHTMPGTLYAFDASDGRQLWHHAYGGWGHCTRPDVFVVGDTVWTHVNAKTEFGRLWGNGYRAKDPSKVNYRIQALNLKTGKLQKELPTRTIFNVGHHHRCYRNRSTVRYLFSSRRGVELVDLATGENYQNHWVRSGCHLGNLPCNGLIYVAPHPCGCYIEAKLVGFNALAPARADLPPETPDEKRLARGPAYGKITDRQSRVSDASDWPTYRHDGQRSGATDAAVGTDLAIAWRARVGAKPSAPVIAGGKVFVAAVDAHTVHALDAANGKPLWSYTAGGRVDSPPTIYNGLAIFGSADGRVHCLRASDGALVWRFDAAPSDWRIVAFDQLESPWPVHGSVLVHDGKCWFAAGRSSYLDGGIRVYALDPLTGRVVKQQTVYHPDPQTHKMRPVTDGHAMVGLLNDIPATDGASVFIRQMAVSASGARKGVHLYSTAGYLDSSWFNRTFWKAGRAQTSGVMVLGPGRAYGVELYSSRSRETVFKPGASRYRLICFSFKQTPAGPAARRPRRMSVAKTLWQKRLPIRITALVRAGETLFAAGSPDVVDPADPHGAWEGRKGGVLAAFRADDGEKLAEWKLPAPPAWDGLAAANGSLFVATMDGSVVRLQPEK